MSCRSIGATGAAGSPTSSPFASNACIGAIEGAAVDGERPPGIDDGRIATDGAGRIVGGRIDGDIIGPGGDVGGIEGIIEAW